MSYTLYVTGSKADVIDLLQKLLSAVGVFNDELSASLSIRKEGIPQVALEEVLLDLRDHVQADTHHSATALLMEAPR